MTAFSHMMCRAWNEWAWENYGPHNDRLAPMACAAPADIDAAIAEIQRCAALGFKGVCLPCKPVFGAPDVDDLNYNLREFGLVDNFLWASDFPHQEGSWPYSPQAIERQMGHLSDAERAKILGLNAAKLFGFDIPQRYLDQPDAAALQQQRTG